MSYYDSARESGDRMSGSSDDGGNDYEGIDVDFDEVPFVSAQPTTMVTGTFPEGEGNPLLRFKNMQYNEREDQGTLAVILDDPGIDTDDEEIENSVILKTDGSTDYRVFNEDDPGTEVIEGTGVSYSVNGSPNGGNLYRGEIVDEFEEDRILVTVGGSGGKGVARTLDVVGGPEAGMDPITGDKNGGLIEYKPQDKRDPEDNEETVSRYAAPVPELRPDLYGEEVGILLARREEMFDDYAEQVEDDESGARPMYWYSVFATESGDKLEPGTHGERSLSIYLDDDWGQFNPDAGLPDEHEAWVEGFVDNVDARDEDTIREMLADDIDGGQFNENPDPDEMVEAVQAQA